MTLQEASSCFHLDVKMLQLYEESGFIFCRKKSVWGGFSHFANKSKAFRKQTALTIESSGAEAQKKQDKI